MNNISIIYNYIKHQINKIIKSHQTLFIDSDKNVKIGTKPEPIFKIYSENHKIYIILIDEYILDYFSKNRSVYMQDIVARTDYYYQYNDNLLYCKLIQVKISILFEIYEKTNFDIKYYDNIILDIKKICSYTECNIDKFYRERENYIKLYEGTFYEKQNNEYNEHITQYIFNEFIFKKVCSYIPINN